MQIQLFATCILDTLYPQAGAAVVKVLERLGVEIGMPPGQTCCGQPAFNAGLRREAERIAKHTFQVFERAPGPVVIPSGSCAGMIRVQYPELFAGDPHWLPRAQALADRTYEFCEFLVDVLGVTDVGARFPGRVAYHASCHLLRELKVDRQPRALLNSVRDIELVELPNAEECCGFGGVFSVEHPEISAAILERKISGFEAVLPERSAGLQDGWLAAGDLGCVTNINGGLLRRGKQPRARHIAEILAQE
jgi:L-lactate dehydrogenase complex protein LldE